MCVWSFVRLQSTLIRALVMVLVIGIGHHCRCHCRGRLRSVLCMLRTDSHLVMSRLSLASVRRASIGSHFKTSVSKFEYRLCQMIQ